MDKILHTNKCSKRFAKAEVLSKISLSPDPNCPRCQLNAANALSTGYPDKTIQYILKDAGVYTLDLELQVLRHFEEFRKSIFKAIKD